MSFSEKLVVFRYTVGCWSGSQEDSDERNTLANAHGVSKEDAGINVKNMIVGSPPELRELRKCASSIRSYIHTNSLPYQHNKGAVLVRLSEWERFVTGIKVLNDKFHELTNSFIDSFPDIVERAKKAKGTLLKEGSVPSVETLKRKFRVEFFVEPLGDSNTFDKIADIEGHIDEFKKSFEERTQSIERACLDHLRYTIKDRTDAILASLEVSKSSSINAKVVNKTVQAMKYVKKYNVMEDIQVNNWRDFILDAVNNNRSDDFTVQKLKDISGAI